MFTEPTIKPSAVVDYCPTEGAYIACLASYNAGILHGQWVDLTGITDIEDIQECIDYIISTSKQPFAEEYACHDWSGIPKFLASEHPNWDDVVKYLDVVAELPDNDAYNYLCDDRNQVLSEDDFWDSYCGHYTSEEDYAQETYEEIYDLKDNPLLNYVDWERVWKDMTYDGYSSHYQDGGYHIFRSC